MNGTWSHDLFFWVPFFWGVSPVKLLGTLTYVHGNLRVPSQCHSHPGNKAFSRPYWGIMVVNNPLIGIRPYFLGGVMVLEVNCRFPWYLGHSFRCLMPGTSIWTIITSARRSLWEEHVKDREWWKTTSRVNRYTWFSCNFTEDLHKTC